MVRSPMMKEILLKNFIVLVTVILFGCYPSPKKEIQTPEKALIPVHFFYPRFNDDENYDSLIQAIQRDLEYLSKVEPESVFQYGPDEFTCLQVRESLELFLAIISQRPDDDTMNEIIKKHFQIYRAAGGGEKYRVLFTGYFEPVFDAMLTADDTYKYPLYKKPRDLIKIDLSVFNERFKGESITARIEGKNIVPYYSRYDIEFKRVLQGRGLEIAWLKDPLDVAFLHIQGSGCLRLPDNRFVSVGYQASNGRPYHSIGRYMLNKGLLTQREMSMQSIRSYLTQHPDKREEILSQNPSYVFFHFLDQGPVGNINVPLTPGRSLALDARLFPKGALAYISTQRPVLDSNGNIVKWKPFSRFVLNQDTGGAIRGAGRADLFWGKGDYARVAAGHMKHEGTLYILIKKP